MASRGVAGRLGGPPDDAERSASGRGRRPPSTRSWARTRPTSWPSPRPAPARRRSPWPPPATSSAGARPASSSSPRPPTSSCSGRRAAHGVRAPPRPGLVPVDGPGQRPPRRRHDLPAGRLGRRRPCAASPPARSSSSTRSTTPPTSGRGATPSASPSATRPAGWPCRARRSARTRRPSRSSTTCSTRPAPTTSTATARPCGTAASCAPSTSRGSAATWSGSPPTAREVAASFDDALDDARSAQRLRTALSLDGQWLPTVLRSAHERLTAIRAVDADAGGLVIATDQEHARGIAEMMRWRLRVEPVVVTSDDPTASARIARFAAGTDPWLVAVRMVSEGVDIPRLAVGVFATTTTTELFFRQAVGRFVRWRRGARRQQAFLYIPDDPRLRARAFQIADERRHSLRRQDREDDAFVPDGGELDELARPRPPAQPVQRDLGRRHRPRRARRPVGRRPAARRRRRGRRPRRRDRARRPAAPRRRCRAPRPGVSVIEHKRQLRDVERQRRPGARPPHRAGPTPRSTPS